MKLPPLSLYIHIPWCIKKCPYCDFNSHQADQTIPEQDYIACLLEDLNDQLAWAQSRELKSIFIGGGTPSLFSAVGYEQLLTEIEKKIPFAEDIEITLEANPGTLEREKFRGYRTAGINRLSIGVQSFQPQHLEILGRIHSDQDAIKAAQVATEVGFDNFNLDLMFGLPQQSEQQALADLNQAISLQPTHLSWYQLTIEQNTVFYSKPPKLPNDDAIWEIQQTGMQYLNEHGFQQYEISAYAKGEERSSKHNLNYWTFGDYLAIGAGAHGKITDIDNNQIFRFQKTRLPKDYLNKDKAYTSQTDVIPQEQLPFEFMMNHLRLKQSSAFNHYESSTGLSRDTIIPVLKKAESLGLIKMNDYNFQPTDEGYIYLNNLLELFLPEDE